MKNGGDLLAEGETHHLYQKDDSAENVLEKSFGMMAISESGEMRFLGTATNESLLIASPFSPFLPHWLTIFIEACQREWPPSTSRYL